ncbi:MAPK-interacting and spindle-stabilizing protein-like [Pollicipes pollicipes]|uniref:MAPK-interacting and spindle-stabilizing protein-like n=1 Tax=Pollicipes pollicipes TaxID=41117 RepID=UPI001884AF29|nr:MAPK-interacting and spindle-stabilizing protein-like [Pollicipes pollicipes]
MTPNGPAPYGQSPQTSAYGQSPQTAGYGQSPQQHGLAGFAQAQYVPASANGYAPGSPWPQPVCPPASFGPYSPAGYGGYRQPYMSPYAAPVSEMGLSGYGATNGSSGMLPGGQWAAPGPQAAGWGPSAPAPPAANPFMSCNGSTPVNPHNPFL